MYSLIPRKRSTIARHAVHSGCCQHSARSLPVLPEKGGDVSAAVLLCALGHPAVWICGGPSHQQCQDHSRAHCVSIGAQAVSHQLAIISSSDLLRVQHKRSRHGSWWRAKHLPRLNATSELVGLSINLLLLLESSLVRCRELARTVVCPAVAVLNLSSRHSPNSFCRSHLQSCAVEFCRTILANVRFLS
jgi:hypothetical protein